MPSNDLVYDYPSAVDYLVRLKASGIALGLDRMRHLLAALGDPQNAVPCIHIAGTNGKGSVAAMLEAILRAAGWRIGLYTSPHLVRLGERVQIDRQIMTEAEMVAAIQELQPIVHQLETVSGARARPSYFEIMTALALRHFQRRACDIAIIEVGLGGRLDATNVVTPEVSVITSIGLDHCELLGDTFAAIAGEKAGIIKSRRPVVIGRLPAEAEAVIRKTATQLGAPIISVGDAYGADIARYPTTNMEGDYQRLNAATATLAARQLGQRWRITSSVVERALLHVDWPARWQRFSVGDRLVIVDASHNAEGAAALEANLIRLTAETGRAPLIVAGVLGLSRAQPLVNVICRQAREIHFVVPAQSRACSTEQLRALVPATFGGTVIDSSVADLFPAPDRCTIGQPGDAVVVTGSIYLAGEVVSRLDPSRGPNEGRLQDF